MAAGPGRPVWFVAVGGAAAAVHWSVAVAAVHAAGAGPFVANLLGWAVALVVSFCGHHRLSFRGHGTPLRRSAWRFLPVSAAGFAANQALLALGLRWGGLAYPVLLAGVLVVVAGATWLLSRHWVFRGSSGPH